MVNFASNESTTTPKKRSLGLVMMGLIVGGVYVIFWQPNHNRTEMLRGEVQKLGWEIQHYKTKNRDRQKLQNTVKELERSLHGEHQIFRQEIGQRGLRKRVARIAQNHQLEITHWQPLPLEGGDSDGMEKTPIRVQIEGGYHQVAKFFFEVLHLSDVFSIYQFTIGVADDQFQHYLPLQTNFILTTLDPLLPSEIHKVVNQLSSLNDPGSKT